MKNIPKKPVDKKKKILKKLIILTKFAITWVRTREFKKTPYLKEHKRELFWNIKPHSLVTIRHVHNSK